LPLPGVDMKIIDHDENGIGEIVGRGPNIMLGYFENEEATRRPSTKKVSSIRAISAILMPMALSSSRDARKM
jgi:acyl-CoA synthetase (AMP-forming)/AMP-acid ligase II